MLPPELELHLFSLAHVNGMAREDYGRLLSFVRSDNGRAQIAVFAEKFERETGTPPLPLEIARSIFHAFTLHTRAIANRPVAIKAERQWRERLVEAKDARQMLAEDIRDFATKRQGARDGDTDRVRAAVTATLMFACAYSGAARLAQSRTFRRTPERRAIENQRTRKKRGSDEAGGSTEATINDAALGVIWSAIEAGYPPEWIGWKAATAARQIVARLNDELNVRGIQIGGREPSPGINLLVAVLAVAGIEMSNERARVLLKAAKRSRREQPVCALPRKVAGIGHEIVRHHASFLRPMRR